MLPDLSLSEITEATDWSSGCIRFLNCKGLESIERPKLNEGACWYIR